MTKLIEAAKAVVARWDTPLWKDVPATAVYIGALREAVAKEEAQAVEPVAILTAGDVAEIEDALLSTGRHNRLAYALRSRLGHPELVHPAPAAPERQPVSEANYEAQQVAVPQGWKLLPVEPTMQMLHDMAYAGGYGAGYPTDAYRALLTAAPQPPQGDVELTNMKIHQLWWATKEGSPDANHLPFARAVLAAQKGKA